MSLDPHYLAVNCSGCGERVEVPQREAIVANEVLCDDCDAAHHDTHYERGGLETCHRAECREMEAQRKKAEADSIAFTEQRAAELAMNLLGLGREEQP